MTVSMKKIEKVLLNKCPFPLVSMGLFNKEKRGSNLKSKGATRVLFTPQKEFQLLQITLVW